MKRFFSSFLASGFKSFFSGLFFLLFIVLSILLLPIFLLLIPGMIRKDKKFQKNYQGFLETHDGKELFCYTSKKSSRSFIEKETLPELENLNVILLEGKTPVSEFPAQYISYILYSIKDIGFPNLMLIKNGQVYDLSLKNPFYKMQQQERSSSNFIAMIDMGRKELREKADL